MADPYRSAALVVLPTHREVVRCGWCAWYRGHWYSECDGPPAGDGKRSVINRDGDCPYYRDSFATRLLRRFGLRSPALVQVTERDDKPDSARPRNGGAGHRDPWTQAWRPAVREDAPPPAPSPRSW